MRSRGGSFRPGVRERAGGRRPAPGASGHTPSTTVVTVCVVRGSVTRGPVGPPASPPAESANTPAVIPARTNRTGVCGHPQSGRCGEGYRGARGSERVAGSANSSVIRRYRSSRESRIRPAPV